jgi:quinone-modifying oxidoreductase subunit QmoC
VAQWGLKDRLMADPDIWLCHQCNDCSSYCPRGAKPSDLMASVRKQMFEESTVPKFMGKMVNDPKYMPLLFALPIVILLVALFATHGGIAIPEGEIVYSKFFPVLTIEFIFIPFTTLALIAIVAGVMKFWKNLSENSFLSTNGNGNSNGLVQTITDVLSHRKFASCKTGNYRLIAHIGVFYGFIGLAITTTMVAIYLYVFGIPTPLSLTDPVKLLGNFSALITFVGCTWLVLKRLVSPEDSGKGTYSDWLFLLILYATVITGICTELIRLSGVANLAYPTYFVHLLFIFFLLVYSPYTKFAHVFFRVTAMFFAKKYNRDAPGKVTVL